MNTLLNVELLNGMCRSDNRGELTVFDPLPFVPVRFFIIHDTAKETSRGHHAHRTCTQALCATHGAVEVLVTNCYSQVSYSLDTPSTLLVVPPGHWLDLTWFSVGASLLVLADQPYEESDYIRDFDEFVSMVPAA